jgi:hypothetical protein
MKAVDPHVGFRAVPTAFAQTSDGQVSDDVLRIGVLTDLSSLAAR